MVSSSTERGATSGGRSGSGPDADLSIPDVATGKTAPARRRRSVAKDEEHVSQALRTVYQRAVDEAIPSEMLDLLSKLG